MAVVGRNIARVVLGASGSVISAIIFLLPARTFLRIRRTGSTEGVSDLSYLAALMSCLVSILYGLPIVQPHSALGSIINGAGCTINAIYIIILLVYSDHRRIHVRRALLIMGAELIFMGGLVVYVVLEPDQQRRMHIIGVISSLISIGNATMSFPIMRRVIQIRSTEGIPFFTTLASSANGVCGLAYGFIPFNPYVVIPTSIVTVIAVIQVVLYAIYHRSRKATNSEQAALDVTALDVAALDVAVEELVIPHLGGSTNETQEGVAMEIAEALLGALLEEAVNAFMEGVAIEIAEVVLGALLEEAMIDIYL